MVADNRWLLPEGIEELLPAQAQRLERWRSHLLSVFQRWGYQLVIPPLVEYLDSLLIGVGSDLELDTFKLTDPQSGRLLGVRADITPQVARIDAHRLQANHPVRLSYIGSVLRTQLTPAAKTRNPILIGAELYGHQGIESDFEIICMMLECLSAIGVKNVYIDLGHVGIFRELMLQAGLPPVQEKRLFEALQRKAIPDIADALQEWDIEKSLAKALLRLAELNGGAEVLTEAQSLASISPGIEQALAQLHRLSRLLQSHLPHYSLHYDLAELRGYTYHTGVVFAAFVPGFGQEIAKGGRYDNIGKAFGRGRAATGFSSDLMTISALMEEPEAVPSAIFAPFSGEFSWMQAIRDLRARGETVISELPGQTACAQEMGCDRILEYVDNQWVVKYIES